MTGPQILARFAALPFADKIELACLAKTRVEKRGYRAATTLSTNQILALAWFAGLFLDDHPAIRTTRDDAAEPVTDDGEHPRIANIDTKGTKL